MVIEPAPVFPDGSTTGANIAFPSDLLAFVGASPSGMVLASREGRLQGLLEPFAVTVGVPVEGIRVDTQIVSSPSPNATLQGSMYSSNDSGIAMFSRLKLQGPPGTYRLMLVAVDWPQVQPLGFNVTVRPCLPGETSSAARDTCLVCPPDFYGLQPERACASCPLHADCPGGAAITPSSGYWHSAHNSTQVHRCPQMEACAGNRSLLVACDNTTGLCAGSGLMDGQCSTGYMSTLCGRCAPGFGSLGNFRCAACLSRPAVMALYALALLMLLLVLAWMTHCTVCENRSLGPARLRPSELIKILVRYGQYVVILSSSPLPWPQSLKGAFTAVSWLYASGGSQAVALDCLASDASSSASGIPLAMRHLLVYLLTPAVLLAVLVLLYAAVWLLLRLLPKRVAGRVAHRITGLSFSAKPPPSEVPASFMRLRTALDGPSEMYKRSGCSTGASGKPHVHSSVSTGDQSDTCQPSDSNSASSTPAPGAPAGSAPTSLHSSHLGAFLLERLPVLCLVTLFTFFPALVRVGLAPFACYPADSPDPLGTAAAVGWFWVHDMSQMCWGGWHLSWALGLGVPCVLLFCCCVPLGIWWLLKANTRHLDDSVFRRHFGFLYRYYSVECYWWEAVSTMQTVVLVAISVFGASIGVYYQVLLLTAAFVLILLPLLVLRPMALRLLHVAQLASTGVLCLTAFVSLSFIHRGSDPGDVYREVVGALLLTANALWVMWVLGLIFVSSAVSGFIGRTRWGCWLATHLAPLLGLRCRPISPSPTDHLAGTSRLSSRATSSAISQVPVGKPLPVGVTGSSGSGTDAQFKPPAGSGERSWRPVATLSAPLPADSNWWLSHRLWGQPTVGVASVAPSSRSTGSARGPVKPAQAADSGEPHHGIAAGQPPPV